MKEILKSNAILLGLGILSTTVIVFWSLTTNRCLKITSEKLGIEASCNAENTSVLQQNYKSISARLSNHK